MRFLLDENADLRLKPYLEALGHDVTAVVTDYQASLADQVVLALAYGERRILITNDRDFGTLIVREGAPHAGVIYFRLKTTVFAAKRDRLAAVLTDHAERLDRFITVTDRSIRLR